jgi:imidazolonepropionase
MHELEIIADGAVAVDKDKIIDVGRSKTIAAKYQAAKTIDAGGKTVTPGLIDAHTHPVFAGDRSNEFEMRLKGATYQEISAAGGGIKSTVKAVRKASEKELVHISLPRLESFISCGTTTIDAKSGYGLTLDDELKMLRVIRDLGKIQPLELIPTFLGAHEIPPEYQGRKNEYVKLITEQMIPAVINDKLAEFCDIFCEKGVFEIEESRYILDFARKHGLKIKLHADEFAPLGGAELAAELGAISADHLMAVSDKGIRAMKEKGVIAVLLPGTTFTLGLKNYAPARKIIDNGNPMALATDFNPGTCFCESLPAIMNIACTQMKMTPAEALTATTINAAWAIGRGESLGSMERGKQADLVIWNIPSYKHIPYHFGVNLAMAVIKRGKRVI